MLLSALPMLSDNNSLTQHLTGGGNDYVTAVCDNGEIKINNFVLVSLSIILRNLVEALSESNVILLNGMKKDDLLLLFERLSQQATEFEPKEYLRQTILSILTNIVVDSHVEEKNKQTEETGVQDDLTLDTAMGFITEDHDYLDTEAPIIIKFQRPLKIKELTLEKEFEMRHNKGAWKRTCEICGKSMYAKRLKGHLLKHMKLEKSASENTNEKKACQHCGKLFKSIRDHVRDSCSALQYEEATCQDCGKVFRNAKFLRAHIKVKHSNIKKESCVCNICGKVLKGKGSLKMHHRAVHEIRERTVKCEQCGKLYDSDYSLKTHIKKIHEEKPTCSVCGIKVRNLMSHMESIHTKDEDKKYQCQDCGKGFNQQRKLEYHQINMHLKTRPFNCRYGCDISYNDHSNRNAHEKKTHGKLFTTVREEKLKEKIKLLGLDEKSFTNPIM